MRVINLTPHDLVLLNEANETVKVIPPDGRLPRVIPGGETPVDSVEGFPVWETTPGQLDGLPDPDGDTMYVVSQVVVDWCNANAPRKDLLVPYKVVRDGNTILGCRGFARKLA